MDCAASIAAAASRPGRRPPSLTRLPPARMTRGLTRCCPPISRSRCAPRLPCESAPRAGAGGWPGWWGGGGVVRSCGGRVGEAGGGGGPRGPAGAEDHRYAITDRGTAALRGVLDDDVTFPFAAIPDRAPTISLTKDPEPQARGALQLAYKMEDDYGAIGAQALFALKQDKTAAGRALRPLYGAPDFPLLLP